MIDPSLFNKVTTNRVKAIVKEMYHALPEDQRCSFQCDYQKVIAYLRAAVAFAPSTAEQEQNEKEMEYLHKKLNVSYEPAITEAAPFRFVNTAERSMGEKAEELG